MTRSLLASPLANLQLASFPKAYKEDESFYNIYTFYMIYTLITKHLKYFEHKNCLKTTSRSKTMCIYIYTLFCIGNIAYLHIYMPAWWKVYYRVEIKKEHKNNKSLSLFGCISSASVTVSDDAAQTGILFQGSLSCHQNDSCVKCFSFFLYLP